MFAKKNLFSKIYAINKKNFSAEVYDLAVIGGGPGGKPAFNLFIF